jgi:hypothetical protein
VTVKRAINLPTPLLGSISPYVSLRFTPGPVEESDSGPGVHVTPVCTGA